MVRLVVTFFLVSLSAHAEQSPKAKYELGIAGGGIIVPSYPGSDEDVGYFIPVPYVIYRGEVLKADRDGGVRGVFYNTEKFELDLGFGGGFATDGEDNEARDGMEELDWTGEVGPRGKWKLINNERTRLLFLAPARYVFSIDGIRTQYQGWVFNPEFNFRQNLPYGENFRLFASLGASWATKKLMEYYYTVEPSEALANRPAYEAQAGYWATNISFLLGKRFPKSGWNVVGGFSWNIYEGSKNVDSPLLRDRYTTSYFLGIAKKLWESEERGVGFED